MEDTSGIPDLNPIENLWHELREFIRRETKPKTKEELIKGIEKLRGILFEVCFDRTACTVVYMAAH